LSQFLEDMEAYAEVRKRTLFENAHAYHAVILGRFTCGIIHMYFCICLVNGHIVLIPKTIDVSQLYAYA